jgi:hypothetical protein
MKIPVFEEVIITKFEYEHLKAELADSRIGKVPTFINLITQKKSDLNAIIAELENVFLELKLHARFPYPTYLISHSACESIFPFVVSTQELPDHFFKKVKRPNNKELQLLNKLDLKVDKLSNLDRKKILTQFNETSIPQKKLYNISKELHFLEMIHQQLHDKQSIKQNEKQKK